MGHHCLPYSRCRQSAHPWQAVGYDRTQGNVGKGSCLFHRWLSDRFGSRVLNSLGLAVASMGLFFLSRLTQQVSFFDIIWLLIVAGLGQALFQSPNNNAIMSSVPENRIGIASGFLATVRVLGQGFSVALAGAIFTSLGGAQAGELLAQNAAQHAASLQNSFVHAFHVALLTSMVISSIGVFTSLARGRSRASAN